MNIVYMLSIHCAFDERSALPTCGVAHSLVSYKHQKAQVDHMSPYAWCGSISVIMPAPEGLD